MWPVAMVLDRQILTHELAQILRQALAYHLKEISSCVSWLDRYHLGKRHSLDPLLPIPLKRLPRPGTHLV